MKSTKRFLIITALAMVTLGLYLLTTASNWHAIFTIEWFITMVLGVAALAAAIMLSYILVKHFDWGANSDESDFYRPRP